MFHLKIFKAIALISPLILAGCQEQPAGNAMGMCNNPKHFNINISVKLLPDGALDTSVSPYTLVVPPPTGNGRSGDQRNIFICLSGDASFRADSISWKGNTNDQFGVAKENGNPRKGPKFIVLTNKNTVAGVYEYIATVNVTAKDGTVIPVDVDPRVDNKGGGHTLS